MVHLCETRLSVMDTEAGFYTRVVGMKFAYRDPNPGHRFPLGWRGQAVDGRPVVPGHDLRWQLPRVAHRFRCESV